MDRLRDIEKGLGTPERFIAWVNQNVREHKWTQRDLANEAGVAEQHISRWLRGHVRPGLRSMLMLNEAVRMLNQREVIRTPKGGCRGCE